MPGYDDLKISEMALPAGGYANRYIKTELRPSVFRLFRYTISRRTIGVMCLPPDILIVFLNSAHMCGTRGRLKVPDPALGSSSERPSG
jgi:hypothetical protein